MILEFIGVIVSFTVLALILLGVVMAFRVMIGRGSRIPACGHCAYLVHGLGSFQCPECGADLRHVGITTRYMRRPAGLVAYGLLWLGLLPMIAAGASVLFDLTFEPRVVSYHADGVLDFPPPSSRLVSINISAEARQFQWFYDWRNTKPYHGRPDTITLKANQSELTIDLIANEYRFMDSANEPVVGAGVPDGAAVLRWLETAWPNARAWPPEAVLDEAIPAVVEIKWFEKVQRGFQSFAPQTMAADDWEEARPISSNKGFNIVNKWSDAWGGPARVVMWTLAGFWFLVWIGGVVVVMRRARLRKVLYSQAIEPPATEPASGE